MGRRNRGKNYRYAMKWSIIAILFITMIVPLSVGTASYINEQISKQHIRAWELNNETLGYCDYYLGGEKVTFKAYIYTTEGNFKAEQSPAWDANGTWDSVYIQTGATGSDNTSKKNLLTIATNLTPEKILNKELEKFTVKWKGLKANADAQLAIYFIPFNSTTDDNIYTFVYNKFTIDGNGTLEKTIEFDPAVVKAYTNKDKQYYLLVKIYSANASNEIFEEGSVLYFDIYATKPKTTIISKYSALEIGIFLTGIITFFAAIAATGYFNPLGYKQVITSPLRGLSRYYRKKRGRRNFYRRRYRRWY